MRLATLFAVTALASGCATTLSTLTTAETLPPGDMQIGLGSGYYVGLGPLLKLARSASDEAEALKTAAESGTHPDPTAEQKQTLLEAGLGMALMPPSMMFQAAFRYGVLDGLDLGLRYAVNNWRLDGKLRLWKGSLGDVATAAVAFAPGVSRYSFDSVVLDLLEYVKIDDFSRWDFEAPLIVSLDFGQVFKLYGAARVGYSRYSLDEKLIQVQKAAEVVSGETLAVLDDSKGSILHVGGTLGVALGYKVAHFYLELGVHHATFEANLLDKKLDLGGLVVFPAAGINVAF